MPTIKFGNKKTMTCIIMSEPSSSLAGIPEHNAMIDCQSLHAELLDLTAGTVWQSHRPISREDYGALVLPANLRKIGIGKGVMDAHYFRRSPGAETDGPVAERDVGGRLFIHCANPPEGGPESFSANGPRLLRVDKHHTLIFEETREINLIRLPDGRDFVQVIAAAPEGGSLLQTAGTTADDEGFELPDGWVLRTEKLPLRTTIHLPNPTEAWFFPNGASFQGPVNVF
jgi:hypothetical protein